MKQQKIDAQGSWLVVVVFVFGPYSTKARAFVFAVIVLFALALVAI